MTHHKLEKSEVINRINKIIGQTSGIKRMLEEERDCTDLLIQIAAARSALATLGVLITEDHIEHCLTSSFTSSKGKDSIGSLSKAVRQLLK